MTQDMPQKTKNPQMLLTQDTKMLPAPVQTPVPNANRLFRLICALVFAIVGYDFANSSFFYSYPLFGMNYLAQILITPIAALIGYYFIPDVLDRVRYWLEKLIINTIVEIVSNFWELQSKKIQQQRRQKQKQKIEDERTKITESLKSGVVLDTSVLIDGRIVEVVKLGFLEKPLIVPQEVIDELHALSDSKDALKRQKGRRGLDIIRELKRLSQIYIQTIKTGSFLSKGVDTMLLRFCKNNNLKMATLDFNLEKVAVINGIKVLNLNALANSLKTVMLPGEAVAVKVIHEGKEKGQGVGYLEDGTMVVIESANDKIGQVVNAKVAKVIQSDAGKIIFSKT